MTAREPTVCTWCRSGSTLDCGSGHFRDFDSDFSYGIDVCGGCGGLGRQINVEDFRQRTQRIINLRFEYCPTSGDISPAMSIRLEKLEALIYEVSELFRLYGREDDQCFAKEIANGCLQQLANRLKNECDFLVKFYIEAPLRLDAGAEACRPALIAAHKGDLEEADRIFQRVSDEYPNSSFVAHDFAVYLITFHRSYKKALPWFEKAIELAPKMAIHFCQLAKCYLALDQPNKALEVMNRDLEDCPDMDECRDEIAALKKEAQEKAAAN